MTFEAGAAEVNAGMTYVGELEGRMRHLVLDAPAATRSGSCRRSSSCSTPARYRQNPRGALDLLLAGMADARIHVVGIADPAPTSGWCARGRRCATRSTSCASAPMDEARSLALAARKTSPTPKPVLQRGARARPPLPRRRRAARLAAVADRHDAAPAPGDDALTMEDVLGTITERSGPAALAARRARAARRRRAAGLLRRARDRPARGRRTAWSSASRC